MKRVFLIVTLIGFCGSVSFARLNTEDPNLRPNGAGGATMSDYVMMAAEVIAVGAGLGTSEQPFPTSSVQDPSDSANISLTNDTKGDEPESNEPGVEI